MPGISFSDKLYEPTKLAAIIDTLVSEGVPAAEALRNVEVPFDKLHDPATRISIKQLLAACQNAGRLSRNPHLPYSIGASVHVSAYGMYGYAILCSTSFRRAMDFATSYHPLATPLTAISYSEEPGRAVWTLEPVEHSLSMSSFTASSSSCRLEFTPRCIATSWDRRSRRARSPSPISRPKTFF